LPVFPALRLVKSRNVPEQISFNGQAAEPPLQFNQFCNRVGVVRQTAWRWCKRGWLRTINIAGRQYVPADAIAEFNRRAAAGDFAKEHKTPMRKRGAQ
jgi:hypothetical protein